MSEWYALRMNTGREGAAAAALAERGFAVFLPMQVTWRVAPGRGKLRDMSPLIPGYVFVLCQPTDFAELHGVEGCSFVRYLRDDGVLWPIAFPTDVILGLQADERAGVYDYTRHQKAVYRPKEGERIRVVGGPYLGFIGRVLSTPRKDRVHVMLEGPHGGGKTFQVTSVALA